MSSTPVAGKPLNPQFPMIRLVQPWATLNSRPGVPDQRGVVVRVHVDEARAAHELAAGIKLDSRRPGLSRFRARRQDPAVADRHVTIGERAARPISDKGAPHDNLGVGRHWLMIGRPARYRQRSQSGGSRPGGQGCTSLPRWLAIWPKKARTAGSSAHGAKTRRLPPTT